jgi:hypothetical protein
MIMLLLAACAITAYAYNAATYRYFLFTAVHVAADVVSDFFPINLL